MKKLVFLIFIFVALTGCAQKISVVQLDEPDTFMATKEAEIDYTGLNNLRFETIDKACIYCMQQKKFMRILDINEFLPDISRGIPRVEVHFMCLNYMDDGNRLAKVEKEPYIVIIEPTMANEPDMSLEQKINATYNDLP